MPTIKQYSAPNINPQPEQPMERALQANEQIARTIGRFASQDLEGASIVARGTEQTGRLWDQAITGLARTADTIGKGVIEQNDLHQTQQAKLDFYSETSAHQVQAERDYKTAINQVQQNPNDPKPLKDYNEAQEQWRQGLQDKYKATPWGQDAAARYTAEHREVEAKAQFADMATITVGNMVNKMVAFGDNQANIVTQDPSKYDFVKQQTQDYVDAMKDDSRLSPAERNQIAAHGRELMSSYAMGAVTARSVQNPGQAKAELDSGKYADVLSAQQIDALNNKIDSEKRLADAQARAAKEDTLRDQRQAFDQSTNQLFSNHMDAQGNFTNKEGFIADARKIALQPGAPADALRTLVTYADRPVHPPASDADLLQKFSERAAAPPGSPQALTVPDILKAQADGLLSNADATRFRTDIRAMADDPQRQDATKQFQTWMSAQRSAIVKPLIQGLPAPADQYRKWGDAQIAMKQAFDSAYASGKWRDLLDPNSSSYLGKALASGNYVADPRGYLNGLGTTPGFARPAVSPQTPSPTAPTQRKPNQTPEQFLKLIEDGRSVPQEP